MICGVRPMLVRAAFALTAALSFAWPAQAQGDSSLSGLFSPAPMAGSFQGRFASERKLAPMFTRPGVISALSGLSMESPKSESENSMVAEASSPPATGHKGAVAVLRELLLIPRAEGAPSAATPSPQQQEATAPSQQEETPRPQTQTVAAADQTATTSPPGPQGPLWTKKQPARIGTRQANMQPHRPLGRVQAAFYEHPGRTASGEKYNPDGLTAAHKTLPFGTRLRVVNQRNGRSVIVRINDRVPRKAKFALDLSRGSARVIGMASVAPVVLYAMR